MMAGEPKDLDIEISGAADRPVTIAEAKTEFEASLIVTLLKEEGIEAFAYDRFRQVLPFRSHFSGIPVQVRASDEIAARDALSRRITESADIDWDEVDVGEREDRLPLGKARRAPLAARIAISILIVIVLITLIAMLLSAVM